MILKLFVISFLALLSDFVIAATYYFPALMYDEAGGWITPKDSPQAACDAYAGVWGWNGAPYSYALLDFLPGRWKCQRYNNAVLEPFQYTWIFGRCQKDPAPILTGSDWAGPNYDENHSPSCNCADPKIFDRGVEWCTAAATCLWYPDNKATGCGRVVDSLLTSVKPSTDPTSIFHNNQTCIAKQSCDARCKMGNCKWLNEVIPNFVNPYLQKTGNWLDIESICRNKGKNWFNDRVCAESMARNHIFRDLLPALVQSGCGSESDWSQVFQTITQCTGQIFESSLEKTLASAPVYVYRQVVRSACIASRAAAGLDPEINLSLKGKSCAP